MGVAGPGVTTGKAHDEGARAQVASARAAGGKYLTETRADDRKGGHVSVRPIYTVTFPEQQSSCVCSGRTFGSLQ